MPGIARYAPCPELHDILLPALAPCPHFADACLGIATWDRPKGHVPRGFVGALGNLAEIEFVLIVAEPGNPFPDQNYGAITSPVDLIERVCRDAYRYLEQGRDPFHRNIRAILDACWPRMDLADQLRKTWITESFLCSAPIETGNVAASAWRCCSRDYLRPQLDLLKNRAIVACGGKARNRVRSTGYDVLAVGSVAPPGCNQPAVRASWDLIPAHLRGKLFSRLSGELLSHLRGELPRTLPEP